MTMVEKRIRALEKEHAAMEKEIENLKACSAARELSYYDIAKEKCHSYWTLTKQACDGNTPYNSCLELTRIAFKDKRSCCYCGIQPNSYIASYKDADEFFALFKQFLTAYMQYQRAEV